MENLKKTDRVSLMNRLLRRLRKAAAGLLIVVVFMGAIPWAPSAAGDLSVINNPFRDVKEGKFYYNAVLWALDNHITTGTSEDRFSPNDYCTRGQIVTFLWRTAGSPEPITENNPFKDVKPGKYYYDAVLWAVENGITQGTSPNQFSPNENCTRAQAVTFLYRAAGSPEYGTAVNPFKDVISGKFYYDAVLWAVENEITTGTSESAFSPGEYCSRGQIVTFLYRAVTNLSGTEDPHDPEGDTGERTIYSVTELEVENGNVLATVNVNSKASLRIDFLDELDESLLFSTFAETPEYSEMGIVTVPFQAELPEYFLLRGVLLDENGKELCQPFTSLQYTSAYKEFKDKDIEDFGDALVINFDDDMTTNFGVLASGVKVVESDASSNVLTLLYNEIKADDGSVEEYEFIGYRVENPDGTMRSLHSGDVVTIADASGYLQIFKVDTLEEQSDGSLLITSGADGDITEYYDYIDLDISFGGTEEDTEPEVSLLRADSGQEVLKTDPNVESSAEFGLSQKLKYSKKFFFIEGEISAKIKVELKIQYDSFLSILKKNYLEVSVKETASTEISIRGGVTNDYSSPDGKPYSELVNLPIAPPVPLVAWGFKIEIRPAFVLSFKGKVSAGVEYEAKTVSGYKYNYVTDVREDFEQHESNVDISAEGEFDLEAGVEIPLKATFLEKVMEAKLAGEVGFKIHGSTEVKGNFFSGFDKEEKHVCRLCVDGNIRFYIKVDASLKFCFIKDVLDLTVFDLQLYKLEGHLADFYISILNDADSIFHGKPHLGLGECPNRKYLARVRVINANNMVVTGGELHIIDERNEEKASGAASLKSYLYNGRYTATGNITLDGVDYQLNPASFTISDKAAEVQLLAARTFTVSFLPNGGSGSMGDLTFVVTDIPVSFELPECEFIPPENHVFKSWSVNGGEYAPGDSLEISGDTEVKAEWKIETHRYEVIDSPMTWPEAKSYCESMGGHLATITSQEEQELIVGLASLTGVEQVFIGGFRESDSDKWQWVTGEEWNYTNWRDGEPDNYGGNQTAVRIVNAPIYGWYWNWDDTEMTGDAGNPISFVCEWE